MKNEKGASHLEFILSFVIFVTFLLFVYSALEPALKIQASKQPVLDYLRFSLVDDFAVDDLTTMTINYIGGTPSHNCIKFNIVSTKLNGIITTQNKNNLIIKKESGEILNYKIEGTNEFKLFTLDSTQNALLKIYYSESVTNPESDFAGGCRNVDDGSFTIGSLKEGQKILESGVLDLITQYETDYEQLKTDLNLPEGNDFTFSFELSDGTVIEPAGVTIPSTDVYATTFPLEYLDENANPKIGFLTIKVW